jgi:hypothetical protein
LNWIPKNAKPMAKPPRSKPFFEKDGETLWQMFEDEHGLYVKHLKTGKTYHAN